MTFLKFGRLEWSPTQRRLLVDGEAAEIGARAFDLLSTLIEHRDRVVGKDELLHRVWQGVVVEENNLTVQVAALRKVDFPARVGGEEFAAILEEPHPGALGEIAERVRQVMAATPVTTAKGPLRVTVSVGVAHVGVPGADAVRALYHDADSALYAAKRAGRDRVVITGRARPVAA